VPCVWRATDRKNKGWAALLNQLDYTPSSLPKYVCSRVGEHCIAEH